MELVHLVLIKSRDGQVKKLAACGDEGGTLSVSDWWDEGTDVTCPKCRELRGDPPDAA